MTPRDFYSAVYSTAIGLGANDVQARLAAAQASEETGFGQSMVGGNLFGIKAGSNYTGPSVTASTEEEYNGNTVRENASFRAYNSFEDSVKDYLGMVQQNFPDAWNAPTFSDAVKGLQTGVYGSYASRSAYPQHITAIDKQYGSLQFAQNPENVPTPYGPNDLVDLTGLPNDVVPVTDQNFVNVDPQFAYAQNPANVPTPEARPSVPLGGGLLTALQDEQPAQTPFDAVMSPVEASGLLGANPALEANATARPMMDLSATGLLGTTPGFEASAAVPGFSDISSTAGFDQSRFDGGTVSVAPVDASRFASSAKTSRIGQMPAMDMSRMPGLLDPATNTQSFMDQPAAADLGSFPDAYAAQRGPSTGLLSADFQSLVGNTERQLQDPASLAPMVNTQTAMMNVPATGLLAGNAPLAAQATVPSIPGQMSPAQIGAYQQMAASAPNITNLSGFTGIFDDGSAYQNVTPAAAQVPDLEQTTVADQPTISSQTATVEGPATTPALDQQEQQQEQDTATAPARSMTSPQIANKPTLGQRISKAINPGTIGGGLLGGLAAGPVGGLVGGLLGNSIYSNGGISGLLGPSFSPPTNQIAGGMANIAGLYGGAYAPGTFAVANNGATITAQPGGYTTYENKYGVVEAIGPDGKISGYFGSGANPDDPESSTSSGGFFGGLFG